jgi:condensin complex subunit 2
LLHLANEQGLKLESEAAGDAPVDSIIPDDEDDMIAASKPGDLWGIKVRAYIPRLSV